VIRCRPTGNARSAQFTGTFKAFASIRAGAIFIGAGGKEFSFEQEVEYRHLLLPNQKITERLARFRQVNMEQASAHHDALEFPNGKIILLARLCEGQHATVLQLPVCPRATNEAEQQKRGSLVS
jgi:hypothetical protein